jgi:hypothetical protein
MAFGKEVQTHFGVSASYWKIDEIRDDFRSKQAGVVLRGYASKDVADARKGALGEVYIEITQGDYVPDMTREQVYNHLTNKTLEWCDAEFV